MEIGDTQVITPYDDAYPFDPDWRHVLSLAWADTPEWVPRHKEIAEDPWVCACRDYFALLNTGEYAVVGDKWKPLRRAMSWNDSQNTNDPKFRIESLLLTGSPFCIIAEDMGGGRVTDGEIETYCRLFFDVRDNDGSLTRSCFLRAKNSMPAQGAFNAATPDDIIWKSAAMSYGYKGLMFIWGWPPNEKAGVDDTFLYDEILRSIQARQMEQIMRRDMGNFDMNAMVGHYIDYKRMQYDTGEREDADSELMKLTMGVLETVQPQLLQAAKTVDAKADETASIQAKFMAEQNVGGQDITDKGALEGSKRVNDMISKHINS